MRWIASHPGKCLSRVPRILQINAWNLLEYIRFFFGRKCREDWTIYTSIMRSIFKCLLSGWVMNCRCVCYSWFLEIQSFATDHVLYWGINFNNIIFNTNTCFYTDDFPIYFFYIYDKYDIVYILFLLKEKKIITNTGKGELKNLLKNSILVSRSDKPNFSFEHFYIPYQEGNTYI